MSLLMKIAYKLPMLIPRALAGDPTAIFLLTVGGVSAAQVALKSIPKTHKF